MNYSWSKDNPMHGWVDLPFDWFWFKQTSQFVAYFNLTKATEYKLAKQEVK